LKATEYETLIKASDERDTLRILSGTVYAPYVINLPTEEFSLLAFENALLKSYYDVYERVMSYTTGIARDFLAKVYRRYELTCLKFVLRAFLTKVPLKEIATYITPIGSFTPQICADLLKKKEPKEIIDMVKEDNLKVKLLSALEKCAQLHSSIPAESAIDQYFFTTLWKLVGQFDDWDRRTIRILGTEIDMSNINILLRGKAIGLNPSTIKELLIPIRYRLGSELEYSLNTPTALDTLRALTSGHYSDQLSSAIAACEREKTILLTELILKRHFLKENLGVFGGYPFQIGTLLAYLNLKFYEISDVRAIVVGKWNRLTSERIKELLVLYELM